MYLSSCNVVCFAICISIAPFVIARDDKSITSDLVAIQKGELPIILSAPHGGKQIVPDLLERKSPVNLNKSSREFVIVRDTGTEELTHHLADAIEKKMGKKPYFVIAQFHRKYIDANRPAEVAYDNPKAKPHYDAYHQSLTGFCKSVKEKFGRGLLLDVHGQATSVDTIYRGTQNGKTVELLTKRFGQKAQVGPESFFGMLSAAGFKVFPTDDAKEQAGFNGGHIVQTYGSHTAYGIDAIQLEFGSDYRTGEKRLKETAGKLAKVVDMYANRYIFGDSTSKP